MTPRARLPRRAGLAPVLLAAAALGGCSDEEPSAPAASPPAASPPVRSAPAAVDALPEDVRERARLARRSLVAGLEGFRTFSRVDFAGEAEAAQSLQATYAFPDRVHWRMTNVDEALGPNRLIEYRLGALAFQLLPFQPTSNEVEGDARDVLHRRMELRRALMLWPDGFAWEREPLEDGGTLARVPLRRADGGDLGSLEARLGADGRPREMWMLDAAGLAQERYAIEGWGERHGRSWPERFTLSLATKPIWTETLLDVHPGSHFLDLFFLPPDRRVVAGTASEDVRALDLIGQTYRPVELRSSAWDGALEEADLAMEAAADEHPELALDWVPTFELTAEGRPRRVLVRLAQALSPPPAGWTTVGDRPGILTLVGTTADVTPAVLASLAGRVPADAAAGTPYVRLYDDAHGRRVQILLPFRPAD